MNAKREARQEMKYIARELLRGRVLTLIRFVAPVSVMLFLMALAQYMSQPYVVPEGEGLLTQYFWAFLSLEPRQYILIVIGWVVAVLIGGPALMSLCAFFMPRTSPDKVRAERKKVKADGETEEIPPAVENFSWFLRTDLRNKALVLQLVVEIKKLMWTAFLCGGPVLAIMFMNPRDPSYAAQLIIFSLWMIVGYILAFTMGGKYYAAFYLISQSPEMKIRAAIRESARMMRGRLWEFLLYKLSFVFWYALALVSFGLALIYVTPYRATCDAMFIRYIDAGGKWRMWERSA